MRILEPLKKFRRKSCSCIWQAISYHSETIRCINEYLSSSGDDTNLHCNDYRVNKNRKS